MKGAKKSSVRQAAGVKVQVECRLKRWFSAKSWKGKANHIGLQWDRRGSLLTVLRSEVITERYIVNCLLLGDKKALRLEILAMNHWEKL